MKYALLLIGMIVTLPVFAYKNYSPDHPVHVQGYERSDGTRVDDYYRALPGQKREDDSDY